MERTNAFVVKWQTRRNGDTFPRCAHHGISMDTKERSSLILKTTHDAGIYFENILHEFIEIHRNAGKL